MAQFMVRNLEEEVKSRLKHRAARHGWSMEEEVRQILRNAVKDENQPEPRLGSRIAVRFSGLGFDGEMPELHGQPVRPADFES